MNILISEVNKEVLAKIKELVKEEETRNENVKKVRGALTEKTEEKKTLQEFFAKWEVKWDELYSEYKRDMHKLNEAIEDIKRRPFNSEMIDREYDRIQDEEFRYGEEREEEV